MGLFRRGNPNFRAWRRIRNVTHGLDLEAYSFEWLPNILVCLFLAAASVRQVYLWSKLLLAAPPRSKYAVKQNGKRRAVRCRRPGSPPLVAHLHGPWQKAGRAYSPTVGRCGAPTRGPRPAVQRGVGGSARVERRDPRPRAETAAA